MKVFKSRIGEHPLPRSERNIRTLGVLRGATCGCDYADIFVLLKEIR
jgi:N-acetylglucosamine malate deacetylase 1